MSTIAAACVVVEPEVVGDGRAGHAPERVGQHERLGDQALARHLDRIAVADDRDDAVDVVERDQETEQQVRALARLGELVLASGGGRRCGGAR